MPSPADSPGIDILVMRGPTLAAILATLHDVCGLSRQDVIMPGEKIVDNFEVLQRPQHAVILALEGGDFEYKVDIDSSLPRNFPAIVRDIARALGTGVVIPDETTLSASASILLRHGLPDQMGLIEDDGPAGFVFIALGSAG
jgi:hypothetical protein